MAYVALRDQPLKYPKRYLPYVNYVRYLRTTFVMLWGQKFRPFCIIAIAFQHIYMKLIAFSQPKILRGTVGERKTMKFSKKKKSNNSDLGIEKRMFSKGNYNFY